MRWTVLPRPGAKIAHSVSDSCRENGWEIGELFVERGRLDDVFRSLTKGDVDTPATLQPKPPRSATSGAPDRSEVQA